MNIQNKYISLGWWEISGICFRQGKREANFEMLNRKYRQETWKIQGGGLDGGAQNITHHAFITTQAKFEWLTENPPPVSNLVK